MNGLRLPGIAGNYASTPDHSALDITGDIDVRVHVKPPDWTPALPRVLVAKYTTTGNQRSWRLYIDAGGLYFQWSTDGSATVSAQATAAVPFSDGAAGWVRAALDVDNGSSQSAVTFYTSSDGQSWTQLGTVVTNAGASSIFSGSGPLEVGAHTSGTTQFVEAGTIVYAAEVRSGIGGTVVAAPSFQGSPPAIGETLNDGHRDWTLHTTGLRWSDPLA
jgi:hypothetical protein